MGKFRTTVALVLLVLFSQLALSQDYWSLEIPVMDGATNIELSKDPKTGIHTLSYDVALSSMTEPLKFYDGFFNDNGWVHFMAETYKQFPGQFSESPTDKWTSFAARTENDKFSLFFGTLWQNKANNTNAQVALTATELKGDEIGAHVDVVIAPEIDGSSLMQLMMLVQEEPTSLLRLAQSLGADPFQLELVDIDKVRALESEDPFIIKYKAAMDAIIQQYADFAEQYVK